MQTLSQYNLSYARMGSHRPNQAQWTLEEQPPHDRQELKGRNLSG